MKESEKHVSKYEWDELPRFRPAKVRKTKYLWWQFLPERGITTIYGEKGSAKSPFVQALCSAISKGKSFLGHSTHQRRVLYLDMENPLSALRDRDADMRLKMDRNENLRVWTMYERRSVPRIYTGHGKTLRRIVENSYRETGKTMLIVLDHWWMFLKPGDDGRSPGETTPLLHTLKRLCGLGAQFLIVAHPTGGKQKMYGFGEENMDVVLRWTRSASGFKIETVRSRYGVSQEFEIVPDVVHENGKRIYRGFRIAKDRNIEIIRHLIQLNSTLGKTDLAKKAAEEFDKTNTKELSSRDKVMKFIDKHKGKEWKAIAGEHNKTTYKVIPVS